MRHSSQIRKETEVLWHQYEAMQMISVGQLPGAEKRTSIDNATHQALKKWFQLSISIALYNYSGQFFDVTWQQFASKS
jgi:ABC-type long-subunit fatty acid transport system fused permease/ATPase subunit